MTTNTRRAGNRGRGNHTTKPATPTTQPQQSQGATTTTGSKASSWWVENIVPIAIGLLMLVLTAGGFTLYMVYGSDSNSTLTADAQTSWAGDPSGFYNEAGYSNYYLVVAATREAKMFAHRTESRLASCESNLEEVVLNGANRSGPVFKGWVDVTNASGQTKRFNGIFCDRGTDKVLFPGRRSEADQKIQDLKSWINTEGTRHPCEPEPGRTFVRWKRETCVPLGPNESKSWQPEADRYDWGARSPTDHSVSVRWSDRKITITNTTDRPTALFLVKR